MTVEILEKKIEDMEKKLRAMENTIANLSERQNVTEDIEEIKKLQFRYVNALIEADWDAVMECFAEDATFFAFLKQEEIKGKAGIEKWFRESIAKNHVGKEGDFVVHPIISVDGDTATGSWLLYMMYCYPRTGQALFWVQGFYDMKYIKQNGKWKFYYFKWSQRMGLPDGLPPTGLK
jgi:ketosteroid isomerase-like protein